MPPRLEFEWQPSTVVYNCEDARFYYELMPKYDLLTTGRTRTTAPKLIGYTLTMYPNHYTKSIFLRDFPFASVKSAEDYVNSLQSETLSSMPIYDPYDEDDEDTF